MSSGVQQPPATVTPDLTTCDREPIHIPGSIQPHGVLLALSEPDLVVTQASANTDSMLGRDVESVLGLRLTELFGVEQGQLLAAGIRENAVEADATYLRTLTVPNGDVLRHFHALAHRHQGALILELETTARREEISFHGAYALIRGFVRRMRTADNVRAVSQIASEEIRRITGFDRVLVYKFDRTWHGHVIAEARADQYGSYLDLWFPASDIPEQARKLYESNRVRLIADVEYRPVPIVPPLRPDTGKPLDLSYSSLRSVSPVHIEYLKNMGLAASMSFSILTDEGKLWGLVSCHHKTARQVPVEVRTWCDFLTQALAAQIASREQREDYEQRIRLKSATSSLLARMAQEDNFIDGLRNHPDELLQFAGAQGVAVLFEDACTLSGETPTEEQVVALTDWLVARGREEVFATDSLPADFAPADAFRHHASGLLAISISKLHRSYILWFRSEVVQTVKWGGDPRKPVEPQTDGSMRIHPRKSFETWKETVHGRSLPWSAAEVEAAGDLRNAIIGIVLRKAEEMAALSSELQRSNKELESFSYSVSHDLRAPFRHIAGYSELLKQSPTAQLGEKDQRYLDTIMRAAQFAGALVDNLLHFSQVGRTKLQRRLCDMNQLVSEVQRELRSEIKHRNITWHIGELPRVYGDVMLLRLVWQNLLQNAVKYTRTREETVIEVRGEQGDREALFTVRDNGVGFEQEYADKLFGVFQRLHRMEEYEGTGIGLANVRRIVGRHGGRSWAEGKVGEGAVFYFTIPHSTAGDGGTDDNA